MLGIEDCLAEVMAIPGAVDAILIDQTTGTAVASGGSSPIDAGRSAAGLSETLRAALNGLATTTPGGTLRIRDVIITTDDGHHLLKPLETVFDGPLAIYLHIDAKRANIALARHHLQTISRRLTTT